MIVAGQSAADLVVQIDLGIVVAPAGGDRQGFGDVESVGQEGAVIAVGGVEADRRRGPAGILGRRDDIAGIADLQRRIDHAEFGAGVEVGGVAVDAAARHEVVGVAEDVMRVRHLQRPADADRANLLEIVLADRQRAPLRDVGNQIALGIGDRRGAVRLTHRAGQIAAGAGGVVGGVAIDHRLMEFAVIGVGLEGQAVIDLVTAIQRDEFQLVDGVLRTGEDQGAPDREFLHRRGGLAGHAVVGAGEGQIEGKPALMVADGAVELAQRVGGELAPAVFLERAARRIDAPRPDPRAILQRDLPLAPGAAGDLGVTALVGEAVLHGQHHGAAQRVEAVDRIGAHYVDAVDGDVGEQVPVDRVAERLVDAHAILVDRQPLRRA